MNVWPRKFRFPLIVLALTLATASLLAAQTKYTWVEMDDLASFIYYPPAPADVKAGKNKPPAIPAAIKALNGKHVSMVGFMVPADTSNYRVTEFLLTINGDACSFSDAVAMNQWVQVYMPKGTWTEFVHNTVTVSGYFEVGEVFDAGYTTSLYRLYADYVQQPKP